MSNDILKSDIYNNKEIIDKETNFEEKNNLQNT